MLSLTPIYLSLDIYRLVFLPVIYLIIECSRQLLFFPICFRFFSILYLHLLPFSFLISFSILFGPARYLYLYIDQREKAYLYITKWFVCFLSLFLVLQSYYINPVVSVGWVPKWVDCSDHFWWRSKVSVKVNTLMKKWSKGELVETVPVRQSTVEIKMTSSADTQIINNYSLVSASRQLHPNTLTITPNPTLWITPNSL